MNKFLQLFLMLFSAMNLQCNAIESPQTFNCEFQGKDIAPGSRQYAFVTTRGKNEELIASISVTLGQNLTMFELPLFDDLRQMPTEVAHVVTAVRNIRIKFDLNNIVMLGDLYVVPEHRGKGYAHELLQKTCEALFAQGLTTIVLLPDPFEYVNNIQTSLKNASDYKIKQDELIKLYQECGFITEQVQDTLFMVKKQ